MTRNEKEKFLHTYWIYTRTKDRGPVDNSAGGYVDWFNLRTDDGKYYATVTYDGLKLTVSRDDIFASIMNSNWSALMHRENNQ
jgi:hypothetical protein